MPVFTPVFLGYASSGRWANPPGDSTPITGFNIDSRQLRPGECFVALQTARRDGHDYLAAAAAAGASAALVSRPDPAIKLPQLVVPDTGAALRAIAAAHRRDFAGPVVGVSGSAGKTSTKELLALLLSAAPGDVLATHGNLNNQLGVPLTLLRLDPAVHRYAVVEAGIGGPGEMKPLANMISPDLALITTVGPAHLEALGSLEAIAAEKVVLPAAARAGAWRLFPKSCLEHAPFRELPAPVCALDPVVRHSGDTTSVRFSPPPAEGVPAGPLSFTFRRVSDGMASNAALALAAALVLGVTPEEAQARLAAWKPAALRGEACSDHAGRWLYVDCYNANPASMHDALAAFAALAPAGQPRLYVIGGMEELGAQSAAYHRQLGKALAKLLRARDEVVVLAAEPAAAALVAGAAHPRVTAAPDLAAVRTRYEAHTGAVFIKGSRRYQLESLLLPNVSVAEPIGVGH